MQKVERFDLKRILRSVEPLGHRKRETYLDSLSLLAGERTGNSADPLFRGTRARSSQYLIRLLRGERQREFPDRHGIRFSDPLPLPSVRNHEFRRAPW